MDGRTRPLRRRQGRPVGSDAPGPRTTDGPAQPGYALVGEVIGALLAANREVGAIRLGVTPDDFILAVAGIWQSDSRGDWQAQSTRLLDLVMDGLRTGVPGRG